MIILWFVLGFVVLVIVASAFASQKNAALRRSGLWPAPGNATMADVQRLVQAGEKIAAIRCYRDIHHCGLAEAKKAVEELSVSK